MKPLTAAPRDWREGRRLRAWELRQAGWSGVGIAEALGVTQGAVSQWLKRAWEGGGREALRTPPRPGAAPKLTREQHAHLPVLLAKGAEAYDCIGDVWTTTRIAALIRRTFGVQYHPASMSRLLRQIGWSQQKPITRAQQRKEAEIQVWQAAQWPALQAKPRQRTARSST